MCVGRRRLWGRVDGLGWAGHGLPAASTRCALLLHVVLCWRQVAVDVPRTAPGVEFFHQPQIQKSLERILYIWGIR